MGKEFAGKAAVSTETMKMENRKDERMSKKINYKIISANEFLKAKPSGEFDREESKKSLVEIATLAKSPADYEILLDIRQTYGRLTSTDIYEFVAELSKHRHAFRNKIAVLSRSGISSIDDRQFDNAQFMELCAKNRGLMIEAFTSFEETVDWLSTSVDIDINDLSRELS
ncbi:hypothetical protein LCGC14_2645570 [marine sediment metagenome]|uniref:Uncharacterized protein n=1 Tax=marine sediment metagenome TaxID=412755 RepID=A0A0F8ZWC6_9ZZZZ